MKKVSRNDKLEIVLGLAIAVAGVSDGILDDDLDSDTRGKVEATLKGLLVETTKMLVSEEFPKECAENEDGTNGTIAVFANKAIKMAIYISDTKDVDDDGDIDDTDS